jgi:hydroxypyruvate isomerase
LKAARSFPSAFGRAPPFRGRGRAPPLQLDLYHTQITEGDLERKIRSLAGRFAHVQIAGNPHRNEPDTGEVDYAYLLDLLDETGYAGRIGCEYRPRAGTLAGLGWTERYLRSPG